MSPTDPTTKPFAIRLSNVSKYYSSYSAPKDKLFELLSGQKKKYAKEHYALQDVSFELAPGGRLGIVGENGSGKSTLLKILAGVLTPTSGTVEVNGRISALLELGAGLNPDLSGRENIIQYCQLYGMSAIEIQSALPEIIAFSELGEAVNDIMKTYSSGMNMRLGFACAVYVKPDILIVDEALSVGDAYFQMKCLHKIQSLLDAGVTFLYVTHAADSIRSLCDQGIWLEHGQVKQAGSSVEVGTAYQSHLFGRMVRAGLKADKEESPSSVSSKSVAPQTAIAHLDKARMAAFKQRVAPNRQGTGEVNILDMVLLDEHHAETDAVAFNSQVTIRVFYEAVKDHAEPLSLALGVIDGVGKQVLHFNSAKQDIFVNTQTQGQIQAIDFSFHCPLCPGEWGLMAGIGSLTNHPQALNKTIIQSLVDHCVGGARFSVQMPTENINQDLWGQFHVPYSVVHS